MDSHDTGGMAEANTIGESTMACEDATALSAPDSELKGRAAGAMQRRERSSFDVEPAVVSDEASVEHAIKGISDEEADGGARGGIPSLSRQNRAVCRRFHLLERVPPLFASRRRPAARGPAARHSSPREGNTNVLRRRTQELTRSPPTSHAADRDVARYWYRRINHAQRHTRAHGCVLSPPPPPSPGTEASRPIERVESPSRSEPPVSPPAPPLPSPPFPRGTPRSPFLFTPPHALRGGTAGAHETQSHDA